MNKLQYAKVAKIEQFNNVKKITIVPDGITRSFANFKAGQYVILNIEIDGHVEQRMHSIASDPAKANEYYYFYIKRYENGYTSKLINDKWTVGTKLSLSLPQGSLTVEPNDPKTVIAVAKGNALTPFLSIAYAVANKQLDINFIMLHEVDYEQELIFKPELLAILAKTNKVKLVNLIAKGTTKDWKVGKIDKNEILLAANNQPFMLLAAGGIDFYNYLDKIASEIKPAEYKKDYH